MSPETLATSVDVSPREFLDAAEHQQTLHADLPENLEPILLALDPQLAADYAASPAESLDQLAAWLRHHADRIPVAPDVFVRWVTHPDVSKTAQDLQIPLFNLNHALLQFDRSPIERSDVHRRQLKAYILANRGRLTERLRSSYLEAYRQHADLSTYLDLRDGLDRLEPPAGIAQAAWDMTEETVDTWVEERLPVEAPQDLEPLADLLSRARSVVNGTLTQATPVIRAWCLANETERPEFPSGGDILKSLDEPGRLDFDRLTSAEVIDWMVGHGHWPSAMPRTLALQDLGLTQADVDAARVLACGGT